MSSVDEVPRAALTCAIDWDAVIEAQRQRALQERETRERAEQKIVWTQNLSNNSRRNSLGSVTTLRKSKHRTDAATEAEATMHQLSLADSIAPCQGGEASGESPRWPKTAGTRASVPMIPRPKTANSSAPGSKRPSLVSSASSAAADASNRPMTPSRRRSSIVPRVVSASTASHALPSVEHLRAMPLRAAMASTPKAVHPTSALTVDSEAPALLAAIPITPHTTRRASMPCQSATGAHMAFWQNTRSKALFASKSNAAAGPLSPSRSRTHSLEHAATDTSTSAKSDAIQSPKTGLGVSFASSVDVFEMRNSSSDHSSDIAGVSHSSIRTLANSNLPIGVKAPLSND